MMKPFTKIAALILAIVAIAHLARLFIHFQVIIGSHQIPMWISIVGFVAASVISWGLWRESKK